MIVITGAAGFIGSAFIAHLNELGIFDALPVDDFSTPMRMRNLSWKHYSTPIDRTILQESLQERHTDIEAIIHLGGKAGYYHEAWDQHRQAHLELGQWLWEYCTEYQIPFLFASSGAVYESGQWGFADDADTSFQLKPSHPYTQMRLEFDNWALKQSTQPPFWAALRMFNVYGPNEYHKMQNASMVFKGYNEILSYGSMRLFASHKADSSDGGMRRDFVYVKDVVRMIYFLLKNQEESGIYNIGTGQSQSFNTLAEYVFREMGVAANIHYEPIPESIREVFPYHSVADISKLRSIGYAQEIYSLQSGITDYIGKYLVRGEFY